MSTNIPGNCTNAVKEPLLRVVNLKKHFPIYSGFLSKVSGNVYAVDGVSFEVYPGETFGFVGESGCGKTTVARTILNLMPATSGEVYFEGYNLLKMPKDKIRRMRSRMQIIFQDPYSSLDPRLSIGQIISEPFEIHRSRMGLNEKETKVRDIMGLVGLQPTDYNRYPHELSGGQRQRVGIARALALNPKLVVCDEPVSALDVSIQSQIIRLLERLQKALGLTYIFISHGLHVVKHVSNRVAVMYLGKIVEIATTEDLFDCALHPYTRALLTAIPIPDPSRRGKRQILQGDVPSPANPPKGCRFHTRCPIAVERCFHEEPHQQKVNDTHIVACHLAGKKI